MKSKNKPISKQTCSDCLHHWACAAWNVGSIASMDGTNCANFERADAGVIMASEKREEE